MISVPVSKLPQLVYEMKEDLKNAGITNTILGHVGDVRSSGKDKSYGLFTQGMQGNFHALLLFKNDEELQVVNTAAHRMVERVQALEGTCYSLGDLTLRFFG